MFLAKILEIGSVILKYKSSRAKLGNSKYVQPHGIDSKPTTKATGVFSEDIRGEDHCIGYIYSSTKTETGETRIYATDSQGNEKSDILLNKSGDIIFSNGTSFATKYTELNIANQEMLLKLNEELVKIAAGITGAGGAYTPTPINIDYSDAKADKIKI